MTEFRTITDGLRFPEGPIAMPDGSIILVEIEAGRLTRVLPDGAKEVVAEPAAGRMARDGAGRCVLRLQQRWFQLGVR